MISILKKKKKLFLVAVSLSIICISFVLGIHNATLYNPRHGFDGEAHVYYINYLFKNKSLPTPGWEISGKYGETHQPPLYYLIGAVLMTISGTWKTAQYINTFVLWMIIAMVGLGLWKVFKSWEQVLIGMFSLAALPMLNIFPTMVTNELLNTFWIISTAISCIYLISARKNREFLPYLLWLTISVIFGVWTKVSIILISPTVLTAFILVFLQKKIDRKILIGSILIMGLSISLLSLPILLRSQTVPNASNVVNMITTKKYVFKPLEYYVRLDWIWRTDMYNTQYYSLLGAAWNSFWTDGHNAITPFIKFHKKSFVLWSLGFLLLPLTIYGLAKLSKSQKIFAYILHILGLTMIFVYIWSNLNSHYSSARLTYEMGIVVPYAFGLASASKYKKIQLLILLLLTIQFVAMVSFYWILPWWHVTK